MAGGVLCKKVVLEISQNLQEISFARVPFWINLKAYEAGQDSVTFVKFLRAPFLQNTSGQLLLQFLNETHLDVVKDLIQLRTFSQYINNKSSSERCYYVWTEQTDICYANAKKLLQSGKIYIRIAFISLVPFRHFSFLDRSRLISYIYLYHHFAGAIYDIVFHLVCQRLELHLWGWNMAFSGTRMKELGRSCLE